VIKPVLYILFGVLLTGATSFALGRLLLSRLRLRLFREEQWLFSFVLGSACLSVLLFALAAAHLLYKGVFLAVALLAILAAWRFAPLTRTSDDRPPWPPFWKWLFRCAWALFATVYLFYAMAPEWSPDGASYHLGLVLKLYRSHGFLPIPADFYKNMPAGVEMLFLPAFAFGKHSAAAMVHFLFLLVLPLLVVNFGRRFHLTEAGVFAALLVFASPMAGIDGTSAYVDIALATVLFALFYVLEIWERERARGLLAAAGLLAGFAFSIKYTGGIGLVYALLYAGWRRRRSGLPVVRPLALLISVALIFILPWTVKSWIMTGNPVIPFLSRLFPNPYVHLSFVEEWSRNMRHYGLPNYWRLPFEVTTLGGMTRGFIGPVFLLAPFGLFALRSREGRRVLLCALVFLLPYFGNIGTRFLLPALPLIALAMGIALFSASASLAAAVLAAHLVLSFPAVTPLYHDLGAWTLAPRIPSKAALRRTPEGIWLAERFPGFLIDRMVETHVPAGDKVFSLSQQAEAYTTRDLDGSYLCARGEQLQDALFTPLAPSIQPVLLQEFAFPPAVLRAVRVVEAARAARDIWSVTELRIFAGGSEISPTPSWKITSNPNPWDASLAFDGNPATRWRTWQAARPGMFLEVAFHTPLLVDGVRLECSPDQYQVKLKVQGMDAAGLWKDLSLLPEISRRPEPLLLRRSATAELKRAGYRYLLVGSHNFGAEDFRRDPAAWGLRFIDEQRGTRLYRIE
jgi:hypothetical protein